MSEQVDIFLVDDNQDDLDLTYAALKETNPQLNIATARDGAEALDYLLCRGKFLNRDCAQPKLVLLDIKLPKIDGLEVLKEIKERQETQRIPVVMLTSSTRKQDLDASYKAGANSYLVKSVDYEQFMRDVQQLGQYWLGLNQPL
ncbi:MAG: response regulator [Verrucomicrobiales bacterium]